MSSQEISIGLIFEDYESFLLESRFFPSKVGGKPAWLNFENIPRVEDISCSLCKNPCIFLCQIYAPFEDNPGAFHRTIYIFICKNSSCCLPNQKVNLKVLRSQLPRSNMFYPYEPPIEEENWGLDIKVEKWSKICGLCGISAMKHCSNCKRVNYCCRSHQVWDWRSGHKEICKHSIDTSWKTFLFPEYELLIENEKAEENSKNEISEEKYRKMIQCGNAGTLQNESVETDLDLLQMAHGKDDKCFRKFCSQIKSQPDQVIRYNRGGSPLLISDQNEPQIIPNCQECGGERQFEFQIMPQLLNYLKVTDDIDCLDWGVLSIYTCKNSCDTKSKYSQEYIWKQDISTDN